MSEVLDLLLVDLPWRGAYGNPNVRAGYALVRHLSIALRKYPTVRDALEYFTNAANAGEPVMIRGYGPVSHAVTEIIFSEQGIELPKVTLPTIEEKRNFFDRQDGIETYGEDWLGYMTGLSPSTYTIFVNGRIETISKLRKFVKRATRRTKSGRILVKSTYGYPGIGRKTTLEALQALEEFDNLRATTGQ